MNSFSTLCGKQLSRLKSAIILGVFVLLFGTLAIGSFRQQSPTVDEPLHLFAGYSYLKWGDFWVNPEHPPLAKIFAALPLLAFNIADPRPARADGSLSPDSDLRDPPAVHAAQRMLFVQNDADTLFFYAKLPMIALAVVMEIFVYLWSKRLFGAEAAIASTFLCVLDPNFLAHSAMVQTDLPFTAVFFIGTYFFWQGLSQLTWKNLFLTALLFSLAAVTKHSFPVIFLIWGVLGLFAIFSSGAQRCHIGSEQSISSRWGKSGTLAGTLLCALMVAYLFIWAAYGFRFHSVPGVGRPLALDQVMPANPLLQAWVRVINEHHLFPEAWTYGQLFVLKNLRRVTYFFGEIGEQGFWLYFPVSFVIKTPLPTLFLLCGAIGIWFFRRRDYPARFFLLIPVIIYFSLAVWSRLNIGLRHLLPIYPFLFVFIGGAAAEFWREEKWLKKAILIFLAGYYLFASFSIYPHYLAFFNELVGGPKNGHKVLLDSNLDWGQDLKGLKQWMEGHGVNKIYFLYFGKADPQYYGIDAFYLPGSWVVHDSPNNTVPGYLAVSATHLYGADLYLTEPEKKILRSFELGEPVADIGYSILVYRINPADAQAHHNMGFILASRGRLDGAVELFREAVRLQPQSAEAHESLARALTLQGEREEAIQHYQEALRLLKSPPESGVHR